MNSEFLYDPVADCRYVKSAEMDSVDNPIVNDGVELDLGADSGPLRYDLQHVRQHAGAEASPPLYE